MCILQLEGVSLCCFMCLKESRAGVSVVSLYRIQRAPEDVVGVVYRSAAEKQSTYSNHPQRVKDENSPAGRPFMCVYVCVCLPVHTNSTASVGSDVYANSLQTYL